MCSVQEFKDNTVNFPMCVLKDLLCTPYHILIHLNYQEKVWICMEPIRASLLDLFLRRIPEEVLREMAITVSYTNFCTTDLMIFNNNILHTYIHFYFVFKLKKNYNNN